MLLDRRIRPDALPSWMQRSKFVESDAARPIARAIRGLIDEAVQDQQNSFYVGRSHEAAQLQAAFVPPGQAGAASIVVVSGLPGIGRRTLLLRVARDSLSVDRLLQVAVEPGDSVNDLSVKLADVVEPISTSAEAIALANEIQSQPEGEALRRFADNTDRAIQMRELLVLLDDGGLLDNGGALTAAVRAVLELLLKRQDIIVALVTNRRPHWWATPEFVDTPIVSISPLSVPEARQLLALAARAQNVSLSASEINSLAEGIRGYPPAATVTAELARVYGAQILLGPGNTAAKYAPRPLVRYLRTLEHDAVERTVLQILAGNSPLPVQLLPEVVDADEAAANRALATLIDTSLVMPDHGTGWYKISGPVIDYVEREYGGCSRTQYRAVAAALRNFLGSDTNEHAYFELERVRFRALLLSGQRQGQTEATALAADWIRLAEQFYHKRNYERSLEVANAASEYRPDNLRALEWVAKSQIRLDRFTEASETVDRVRRLGSLRDAAYLRGFLERNRGNHNGAITWYERALAEGYGGIAIHRDLAESYLNVGNVERARLHIEEAQSRSPDNPFILSLRIKIACIEGDEVRARALLSQLTEVDQPVFATHRRSRVEYAFGDIAAAEIAAREAVDLATDRPPFEVLANAALCATKNGHISEALEYLAKLHAIHGDRRKDLQTALRIQVEIARSNFEDAIALCNSFETRDTPVALALERDALRGLVQVAAMPQSRRQELELRIGSIDSQLASRFGRTQWDLDPE